MSDLTTTRIFTDGERGITAAKLNDIVGSSTIQPAFYTSKPTAPTADPADIALILKAGAYAQVPISALAGSATQAQIWDTRLRSYNAIGNPNFEVDQRNAGSGPANPGVTAWLQDRWVFQKNGTMTVNSGGIGGGPIAIPGTSYNISSGYCALSLTTAQATLGASDYLGIEQTIEGINWRELSGDVTSLSLLVYSSVANLKFAVSLRSADNAASLVKLCTVPSADTWTLIQLPNIPKPTSGVFNNAPGVVGYGLRIYLACGSSYIAPAVDTWQTGNFLGASGMSNWAASPVNSNFYIAFVQHEPGPLCTTLMDKPFSQNLDECLRYYQKSYPYATAVGAIGNPGQKTLIATSAMTSAFGPVIFPKIMAKTPTVTLYNGNTGAAGSVRDNNGTDHASAVASTPSDNGFTNINFATATTGALPVYLQYTADTGW